MPLQSIAPDLGVFELFDGRVNPALRIDPLVSPSGISAPVIWFLNASPAILRVTGQARTHRENKVSRLCW